MALTWARIAMIPLVVGIFYLPDTWLRAPLEERYRVVGVRAGGSQ